MNELAVIRNTQMMWAITCPETDFPMIKEFLARVPDLDTCIEQIYHHVKHEFSTMVGFSNFVWSALAFERFGMHERALEFAAGAASV